MSLLRLDDKGHGGFQLGHIGSFFVGHSCPEQPCAEGHMVKNQKSLPPAVRGNFKELR